MQQGGAVPQGDFLILGPGPQVLPEVRQFRREIIRFIRQDFHEVILAGKPKLEAKLAAGDFKIEGQKEKLEELLALLDNFDPWFNLVTP
jgi:alkyl sulfatase BDS1-like metallo-beta-lactamase superfamily hydrolase